MGRGTGKTTQPPGGLTFYVLMDLSKNFMKCLKRMYHDQGRDVIFYENAAAPQRRKHATMEAVPLPLGLAADAPAFFKVLLLRTE